MTSILTYIGDGPTFNSVEEAQGAFDQFLLNCFDPPKEATGEAEKGEGQSGDGSAAPKGKRKKSRNESREDAMKMVTKADGTIWILELKGLKWLQMQDMVRGFLTAHYHRGCGNPKASTPFKGLSRYQGDLVSKSHLPKEFKFGGDPSHMTKEQVVQFLQFIQMWQAKYPKDVFEFQ
ncbi:hypothetical protein OG21DRAFT_1489219 [Imleria badia]|nr:hypothetical protein OG21DRAFT_1489219 [Imleria badia]